MGRVQDPNRDRSGITMVVVLAITVIGVAIILILGRPRHQRVEVSAARPTRTPEPTGEPLPLTVYVTGAVVNPNRSYTVPPGSRVQAAIDVAGGVLATADLTRINLADLLRDGAQVHVPTVSAAGGALATPVGGEILNVNTATAAELDTLPGIGPVLAQRIVTYRGEYGAFQSVEALANVSGIGPALLDQIRPLIRTD
ncbi:MAG: ComEA family DNA-binding protein [Chloroflexi bacterium]|nr:ComEA family DNA-binding protein [Chloroflexota bacterium]GIK28016.1 MAG: hypothetical protein BroJett007_11540 [Chloroflexota bacterium]